MTTTDGLIWVGGCAVAVLLVALALFVKGLIVWWAWGYVAVPLFDAPEITFWQAFLGAWACNILFGRHSLPTKPQWPKKEKTL